MYYTVSDLALMSYIRVPKWLLGAGVSAEAVLCYGYVLDACNMRRTVDKDGHVYVDLGRDEIASGLGGWSVARVRRAMVDLAVHGLVDERRRGQGRSNRVYLLRPDVLEPRPPRDESDEAIKRRFRQREAYRAQHPDKSSVHTTVSAEEHLQILRDGEKHILQI